MFDEKKIIELISKNDRKAQKELYQRFAAAFLGICIRYANDKSDAENILQDGFIKIFKNIKQCKKASSLTSWMKRTIVNTAITHYRKNLKYKFNRNIDEIQENRFAEKKSDSDFTISELMGVIKKLPRGYRVVFNLYAIEGYKHKEIAKLLNIDISTSKSQYSRAKKIIREKLEILKKVPVF